MEASNSVWDHYPICRAAVKRHRKAGVISYAKSERSVRFFLVRIVRVNRTNFYAPETWRAVLKTSLTVLYSGPSFFIVVFVKQDSGSSMFTLEIVGRVKPERPLRAAIFDFDGTLSLIREGWQQVMIPLFIEATLGRGSSSYAV